MAIKESLGDIRLGNEEDIEGGSDPRDLTDEELEAALTSDNPGEEAQEEEVVAPVVPEQADQNTEEVKGDGAPTGDTPAAPKETKAVPVSEHIEMRRRAQAAEAQLQQMPLLAQQMAQQMVQTWAAQQQQQAQTPPPEQINPFEDPDKWLETRLQQKQQPVITQMEVQQFQHRAAVSEHLVRTAPQDREEYEKLVPSNWNAPPNPEDPTYPMFEYVQRNPQVRNEIIAHPLPATRALQIARDLQASRPEARQAVIASEAKRLAESMVAEIMAKQQTPTPQGRVPKSIGRTAGSTPSSSGPNKAYADMDEDELEAALRDPNG